MINNPIGNPPTSRARRAGRAARRYAGLAATSIGIGPAVKNMLPMLAGVLASKVLQKKFGDKTPESGNWTWKDYLVGALGGVGASFLSRALFKATPATAQKILEGSFLFIGAKILLEEVVPMSKTAEEWLGQNDFAPAGYLGDGDAYTISEDAPAYEVGDLFEGEDGSTYVLGADWRWRPADDSNRLLGEDDFAPAGEDDFAPAGYYGAEDQLLPPGRLGEVYAPGRLGSVPEAWIREMDRR